VTAESPGTCPSRRHSLFAVERIETASRLGRMRSIRSWKHYPDPVVHCCISWRKKLIYNVTHAEGIVFHRS